VGLGGAKNLIVSGLAVNRPEHGNSAILCLKGLTSHPADFVANQEHARSL
jgi:hypothetical protein